MTRKKRALMGLLLMSFTMVSLTGPSALAEKSPQDGIADARIKIIAYHDNDVYKLKGHYGFTTIVEFGPHEKIETISLDDSEAWQVTKLNRQNVLLIKPLEQNADTNMNILTNQHIYTFQLAAEKAASPEADDLIFRLRFTYPDDKDAGITNFSSAEEPPKESAGPALTAKNLNFNYSYSGAKSLQPERVFDDGKFTYFQFKTLDATPAVFLVDEKGNESLINFTTQGPYLVVERTGRQFTLRDGDISTCIFNESYVRPTGKQGSPTPLGTLRQKKSAAKKSGNNPDPPFLAWFKNIQPATNGSVTYNQ